MDTENATVCITCKSTPVEYRPDSCGCPMYCKRCAMKMASGGKCKNCGSWYASFKRI